MSDESKSLSGPIPVVNGVLAPRHANDIATMAKTLYESRLIKVDSPQAAFVLVACAAELKLTLTEMLTGVCVFNGKPLLYGKLPLSLAMRNPGFRGIAETWTGLAPDGSLTDAAVCKVVVKREVGGNVLEFTGMFGVADAKKAGLWGKGTYNLYPKDMIFHRAKSRALERGFADSMGGMGVIQPEDEEAALRPRVVVNEAAPAASTSAIDAIPDETPTGAGEQAAPPVSPAPVAADKFAAEMAVEMEKPAKRKPVFDIAGNVKD